VANWSANDLVALCQANPTVRLADGADVDLRAACKRWVRRARILADPQLRDYTVQFNPEHDG
jgi:hypothetical protein